MATPSNNILVDAAPIFVAKPMMLAIKTATSGHSMHCSTRLLMEKRESEISTSFCTTSVTLFL